MADETIATGYLRLVPSVGGIQAAIGGQMASAGTAAGGAFAGGFIPSLKGLLIAAGGLLIVREVKQFVDEGIAALSRIETINAQTTAVIQSTGNAANVSATQIEAMANALERTTASEAETIQEGANLLLTFKNIRNEAGKGNDIFNRTVAAMVDVGRAMGTDASGAAIQLGKALNDPIAGIAALTRVGITFTDQQKEQIRALTESGDLLGAQKIILGELDSQFGGSGAAYAETYAGKLALVDNAYGALQEKLASGLMPALTEFADFLLATYEEIEASDGFEGMTEALTSLITDALPVLIDLFIDLAPLIPPIAEALGVLLPAAVDLLRLNSLDPLLGILGLLQVAFGDRSFVDWAKSLQDSGSALWYFAQGAAEMIKGVVNPVIDGLNGLGDAVEGFVNGISRIFGGGTISLPNIQRLTSVVAIGTASLGARSVGSHIPRMADGGTIEQAGWAMVGEAGPELINMNVGAQVRPLDTVIGGRGVNVVNNIYEAQEDGRVLGRKFGREFARQIGG